MNLHNENNGEKNEDKKFRPENETPAESKDKKSKENKGADDEPLEDETGVRSSSRRELEKKEKVTRNILKVASVFIAILMWFYVMSVESPSDSTKEFKEIEIAANDKGGALTALGLTVLEGKGITVDVTVSGRRSVLAPLTEKDIKAYVELDRITAAGKFIRTIKYDLPEGVSIKTASRSTVDFYVDTISGRNVHVEPIVTADVAEGFQRGTPVVAPEFINVSGPQPLIEKIEKAKVEMNLGSFNSTVQRTVPIVLVDKDGNEIKSKYINMSAETAEVTVPAYVIKEVPLIPTLIGAPANPDNIVVEVNPKKVTISGTPEQVNRIEHLSLDTIDVGDVEKEKNFEKNIFIPSGIKVLENIRTAGVRIELRNMLTQIFNVNNIQIQNAPDKTVILRTQVLEIKVRGDAEALKAITSQDVAVTVDLENMKDSRGLYEQDAVVTIPGHEDLHVVGDYSVTVWIG